MDLSVLLMDVQISGHVDYRIVATGYFDRFFLLGRWLVLGRYHFGSRISQNIHRHNRARLFSRQQRHGLLRGHLDSGRAACGEQQEEEGGGRKDSLEVVEKPLSLRAEDADVMGAEGISVWADRDDHKFAGLRIFGERRTQIIDEVNQFWLFQGFLPSEVSSGAHGWCPVNEARRNVGAWMGQRGG